MATRFAWLLNPRPLFSVLSYETRPLSLRYMCCVVLAACRFASCRRHLTLVSCISALPSVVVSAAAVESSCDADV